MRKRKISQNEYIININSRYFVVNSYTYDLIDSFYDKSKCNLLCKNYCLSKKELNNEYINLKNIIDNVDYYDDNINLDFPLKLQWRITNKCNLHCKHCYLGNLSQQVLSDEKLLEICNKIVESNVMEVTITGGEALTVKKLPDIVSSLIKNDIQVNIFTNGLLLNVFEENLLMKLGYNPTEKLKFFISVDGTKDCHDFIRGKGNFDNTIKNIKLMVDIGYKVTTNTVLSKMNYRTIPNLYVLLYNLGVYKIQISNLIPEGNATDDMVLNKKERNQFIEELKNSIKNNNIENRLLYAEIPDEECSSKVYMLSNDYKEYLQKEEWKCSAGIGKGTIDYDGTIYCCPFLKKYALGNIIDDDLTKIWSSDKRYEFLKFIVKNNNNSRVCIAAKIKNKKKGGDKNEKNS